MDLSPFKTEEDCALHLAAARWPKGPVCDSCGSVNKSTRATHPHCWQCKECGRVFSVVTGTPMARSRLPLTKWVAAAFLLANSPKKVTVRELQRQLGVSYKSAWSLMKRIEGPAASQAGVPDQKIVEN